MMKSYDNYSLEQLSNWVHDAVCSTDNTPEEIYEVIKNAVKEEYQDFKSRADRCHQLLQLLTSEKYPSTAVKYDEHMNVHAPLSCDKDDPSPECQKSWDSFWEENYYPDEYQKERNREYNLREAEYYDKRAKLDMTYNDMIAKGYTMTDDGFWIQPMKKELTEPQRKEYLNAKINAESHWNDGWTRKHYQEIVDKYEGKKDKVVKWQLPVEVDGASGEYFVTLPDDLLKATNLKENDQVEWIDQGNGSFLLKKVIKPLGMDEC